MPTSRRRFLATGAIAGTTLASAAPPTPDAGFRYCLNTATLMGFNLPITRQIDIAAQAGYNAIEPWLDSLHAYASAGGSFPDMGKRIADAGLTVESAIAFPEWIVNDSAQRTRALEDIKRDMDLLAQIGGRRIACPPAAPRNTPAIGLQEIAERYRAVLKLGDTMGVVPELEFWGPSPHLSRLSQAAFVAMEAAHPKACILPDVFHLYKGGSDFEGLRLLGAEALPVIHMNDYPAKPSRATVKDSDRIYPGDGVGPFAHILAELRQVAPTIALSLELFNATYWKGDPLAVAKTGLAKMKAIVAAY
jgi:sugar phosphate isomerase/epimerase